MSEGSGPSPNDSDVRALRSSHLPFAVDVRAVLGVSRSPVASLGRGIWSCTHCGLPFAVRDSHSVHFDSGGESLEFVVCPPCAAKFDVPCPVNIDLDATLDDAPDEATRATIDRARDVAESRGATGSRVVRLRDADVRGLAHRHRTTPSALIDRLAALGLTSTDAHDTSRTDRELPFPY